MTIGKGRDYRVAFVEDSIQNIGYTVIHSIELLEKEIAIESKRIVEEVKEIGNGDKETEIDIAYYLYQSNPINIWEEYISDIRGAHFCSIYNFFEKLLKFIQLEFRIAKGKNRNKSSVFHEICNIKTYLGIDSFDDIYLEKLIDKIDVEYRPIRVNISHGETKELERLKEILKVDSNISINGDIIIFHNNNYLKKFISDIQSVVTSISILVEEKSREI